MIKPPICCLFVIVALFACRATACCDEFGFETAGRLYGVAPMLLEAISVVESAGDNRAINSSNRNGTVDVCHMQINSSWRSELGDDWRHLNDPRYCTQVGAWILRQCIERYGYNWNAVACYNTGRSIDDAKTERQKALAVGYIHKVEKAIASLRNTRNEATGPITAE